MQTSYPEGKSFSYAIYIPQLYVHRNRPNTYSRNSHPWVLSALTDSPFNNVAGLQNCGFIHKETKDKCFCEILQINVPIEHL